MANQHQSSTRDPLNVFITDHLLGSPYLLFILVIQENYWFFKNLSNSHQLTIKFLETEFESRSIKGRSAFMALSNSISNDEPSDLDHNNERKKTIFNVRYQNGHGESSKKVIIKGSGEDEDKSKGKGDIKDNGDDDDIVFTAQGVGNRGQKFHEFNAQEWTEHTKKRMGVCPSKPKQLPVALIADCNYVRHMGSVDAAREQLIEEIRKVSEIFLESFNISIALTSLILFAECDGDGLWDSPDSFNIPCHAYPGLEVILNRFSLWRDTGLGDEDLPSAAIAHLVTSCDFSQKYGLSWLNQVCRNRSFTDSLGDNISGTSVSVAIFSHEKRPLHHHAIIAHEMAHNLGALNDCEESDDTECCPSQVDFEHLNIMSPKLGSKIKQLAESVYTPDKSKDVELKKPNILKALDPVKSSSKPDTLKTTQDAIYSKKDVDSSLSTQLHDVKGSDRLMFVFKNEQKTKTDGNTIMDKKEGARNLPQPQPPHTNNPPPIKIKPTPGDPNLRVAPKGASNLTEKYLFSACSIADICGKLTYLGSCLIEEGGGLQQARFIGLSKGAKLDPVKSSSVPLKMPNLIAVCGNGIREADEECDCGDQCESDNCCGDDCKFKAGSACSDFNDPCCRGCQLIPAFENYVCNQGGSLANTSCRVNSYCTGESASCPISQAKADGTPCGLTRLINDRSGVCSSGVCTTRDEQCAVFGRHMQLTKSCPYTKRSCSVICDGQDQCVDLRANFIDGTKCGQSGVCNAGMCSEFGSSANPTSLVSFSFLGTFVFGTLLSILY